MTIRLLIICLLPIGCTTEEESPRHGDSVAEMEYPSETLTFPVAEMEYPSGTLTYPEPESL